MNKMVATPLLGSPRSSPLASLNPKTDAAAANPAQNSQKSTFFSVNQTQLPPALIAIVNAFFDHDAVPRNDIDGFPDRNDNPDPYKKEALPVVKLLNQVAQKIQTLQNAAPISHQAEDIPTNPHGQHVYNMRARKELHDEVNTLLATLREMAPQGADSQGRAANEAHSLLTTLATDLEEDLQTYLKAEVGTPWLMSFAIALSSLLLFGALLGSLLACTTLHPGYIALIVALVPFTYAGAASLRQTYVLSIHSQPDITKLFDDINNLIHQIDNEKRLDDNLKEQLKSLLKDTLRDAPRLLEGSWLKTYFTADLKNLEFGRRHTRLGQKKTAVASLFKTLQKRLPDQH